MNNVFPMRTVPGALWRPETSPRRRPAPASKGITPMTAATDNAGQRQGGRFMKGMSGNPRGPPRNYRHDRQSLNSGVSNMNRRSHPIAPEQPKDPTTKSYALNEIEETETSLWVHEQLNRIHQLIE